MPQNTLFCQRIWKIYAVGKVWWLFILIWKLLHNWNMVLSPVKTRLKICRKNCKESSPVLALCACFLAEHLLVTSDTHPVQYFYLHWINHITVLQWPWHFSCNECTFITFKYRVSILHWDISQSLITNTRWLSSIGTFHWFW